jgi:hypothetical protein
MAAPAVTDRERFLLDLRGYITIPAVLSDAEVAGMNAAIDRHPEVFEGNKMGGPGGCKLIYIKLSAFPMTLQGLVG